MFCVHCRRDELHPALVPWAMFDREDLEIWKQTVEKDRMTLV